MLNLFSEPPPDPPKIILRDYQQACVDAVLEGRRRGVREFPGARAVAGTGQPWRKNPPSEAQIKLLRHLKVSQETIRQLTRGDASNLITKLRAGGGR